MHYEHLRERALTGAAQGAGLAALRLQGMWAWMRLAGGQVEAPELLAPTVPKPAMAPPKAPQGLAIVRQEMIAVWAGLVLARAAIANGRGGRLP